MQLKLSGPDLAYCPGIFLEGLRKITKKRSVDNRSAAETRISVRNSVSVDLQGICELKETASPPTGGMGSGCSPMSVYMSVNFNICDS
jgi:hypothetical protein